VLKFFDRHLALTGLGLLLLDVLLFVLADRLTPQDQPFFGSYDLAFSFSFLFLLLAALGALFFALGVTRSHLKRP
jgi:hypothetical protein